MTREGLPRGRRNFSAVVLAFIVLLLLAVLLWMLLVPDAHVLRPGGGLQSLEPVLVITGPGKGDKPVFVRPLGVAWGPSGDIYVSDTGNGRICIFTVNGRFLREFGRITPTTPAAERSGALQQPSGLVVDDDGSVYVADLRAGVVRQFDRRGRFTRAIKPPAGRTGPGHWRPTDVALAGNEIYVADESGVAIFSEEGRFKRRYVQATENRIFVRPNSVSVALDGTIYVSDTNGLRVVALTSKGKPRWSLPAAPQSQDRIFGLPRGLAVAGDGSLIVTDAFKFCLTHVSSGGEYLGSYGERGDAPAFLNYPNDVGVRGDLALVADKENNRAQVVRMRGALGSELEQH